MENSSTAVVAEQLGRREKKKALTRQTIIDAAGKLFSVNGFDATSIDEICQAADVVKGTFYYHFKSKEDLVIELRREMTEQLEEFVASELDSGNSPLDILRALMIKDARWTEQNEELSVIFVSQIYMNRAASLKNPDTPPSRLRGALRRPVSTVVEAAQQAGQLRADVNPDELTEMIFGFYIHAKRCWLNARTPGTLEPSVLRWLDMLLDGLGAPTASV
ncbi:MAG: TetR/AcrR family transcriptional regulator [Cyanobacteria bacterium SZAS LIN-5]|nr:TetR/AcrR family transcriptional regulator [Cyanobacteria bacterium SZAS LIN-5]RTL38867.1 MAG: TetR/AcrR family transcriptional regulator [Candidatus Melainabacteria bacterium]